MTPETIQLLRSSWARASSAQPAFEDVFYRRLFEAEPSLRSLFPAELQSQREKFRRMLNEVLRLLDTPDQLKNAAFDLGTRHRSYGVSAAHFAPVVEAFLAAMREALGAEWNREAESAWTEALTTIASLMQPALAE